MSIDERIVSMTFDNAKFEANARKTMATLAALSKSLKDVGSTTGLGNLEKAASKVNFSGLSSNLDKLKQKLHFGADATKGFSDLQGSANKVHFGPLVSALDTVKGKLSTFLTNPTAALDSFKLKLSFPGAEKTFGNLERSSDNVKFAGANAAVTGLKDNLQFREVGKSFDNIEKASSRVKLSAVSSAVAHVGSQFTVLAGAASVALGSIVAKAATAGGSFVKSFTFGPITAGLEEYATNLNSIQTILANTKASGADLDDVNKALQELNTYSDQTIYNFSQMAKNIGTFTAAGVDLKTATASIKGIANLAALSGSNSEQASTAMYQLSQAISAGRVSLQDWNSVVNAGMGGTVFQRALAQTAEALGTIKKGAVELKGPMKNVTISGQSFRESITAKPGEKSWLTSDVLTSTLKQFTGDLSDAELAAMGFNAAQIKSIKDTAKTAKLAATEVKTLKGVFDVAKESIGSGWADTFELIFGDFEEAKTLFTGFSGFLGKFIGESAEARNSVLEDWKELGGRTMLIESIKDVFEGLASVVKPVKEAFREIFPAKTGRDLFELTKRFAEFAQEIKIGADTSEKLKRTFAGFFAVLDIGKMITGEILGVIGDLFGAAGEGSGGFLNLTGSVGDFLVSVRDAIKEGRGLSDFFDGLGAVLSIPIKLLGKLSEVIANLFGGGEDSGGLSESLGEMESSLEPLTLVLNGATAAWEGFLNILGNVGSKLGPVASEIGSLFGNVGEEIATAFENMDFDRVFDVIQTGLIGGIFIVIKKALGGGINLDFGGGVLSNVTESLGALTGSLKAMQRNIQAGTLLKIGLAVAALAAGVTALSLIEPKRLTTAMTAVSVGLAQLVGAMALLSKVGGHTAFLTMPFIAGALVLLAAAIDVLAIAVVIFSKLSWEEIAKGLAGVAGSLIAVGTGVRLIPPSVLLIGPGLLAVAVALNLIATAVKIFSTLKWEELGKGLAGVAGSLTAIGIGTKLIGPSILLVGPGLIAVAVALNLLAGAVALFGNMDLMTLGKGMLGIAGSLIAIGLAIKLIPPTVALQAAGLILLSIALTGIAGAVALMGGLKIATIAKGIGGLGLALAVLAGGLTLMAASLPGAVALLAAATALAVLVPVLGILGNMKWGTIVKGLAAIALALGTIGVVGLVAAPGLFALGIALTAMAGAVALAGLGIYLLTSGLTKLGGDGSKAITALIVSFTAFIALLPKITIDFLKGLVEVLAAIAELAPKVVDSMVKIVESLVQVIIRAAPDVAVAVGALISAFLKVLVDNAPKIIAAGFALLIAFLSGIDDNIVKVVEEVGSIVFHFLGAMLSELPRIIAMGANVLVKFLGGIASNIGKVVTQAAEVIAKFLVGITENIPKVVKAAVDMMIKFLGAISERLGDIVKAGAEVIIKFLKGIGDNIGKVSKEATEMIGKFFDAAVTAALDLIEAGAKAVINFINGVAAAVREHSDDLGRAGANLGTALVQGAISGMGAMAGELVRKALSIFADIPGKVKKFFGIDSPSKMFMEIGRNLMEGAILGVEGGAPGVFHSLEDTADEMIGVMERSLRAVPDILDGLMDVEPVVTPVLDLTNVKKGAQELANLTNVIPISAAASYDHAASISAAQEAAAQVASESAAAETVRDINFEQNNYSPEKLSDIEIYRQTRNQIAQVKTVLGIAK